MSNRGPTSGRPVARGVANAIFARVTLVVLVLALLPVPARAADGPVLPQPAMSKPLRDLTAEERARFEIGEGVFLTTLLPGGGLGPVFNMPNCSACHSNPAGGTGVLTVTRFGRDEGGVFDPLEELGGSLLQARAVDPECAEVIPPEANVVALRIATPEFGDGLVEAIPDADLLALERDPPGISGRAHMVEALEEPGVLRVGRFGWKAQLPTMLSFSADAALNELGLTNRLMLDENDPNGDAPPELEDCDPIPDPEDAPDSEGFDLIDRVTDYARFLADPPQTPRSGMTGETLFMSIGCGECHHPAFTTADDPELESALRNRAIRPYSDFLLHEMGATADGIAQGDASALELRTPPLWGLLARRALWHDGRFSELDDLDFDDRVTGAIEAHGATGSEAADVFTNWAKLEPEEQDAVRQFLGSLGRREFDHDGDAIVETSDFVEFVTCFHDPGDYTPDDDCAIADIDQDGDVDVDDYASFLIVYAGSREDCNENGVLDLDDVLFGTSEDTNRNGFPDECDCDRADLDRDGEVGFGDMLVVLAEWGSCLDLGDCREDLDRSGNIDFGDILFIFVMWGPCP